ncbi:hypothetical protein BO221_37230 [Archangium sp. Cb G35]|uniref:hypothetical protein n=1 Tax=Archangium sp. Cb G35 TaxID=1920190 RepID=UPI000936DDC4|nr:hypothetical protein [Archangium sp. Cb G35]OJT19146.1 hypothetical protein BO221_37230 [Archangium sp. Cb G35]
MTREWDVKQWREELVAACRFGEEARARALIRQPGPRKARALLESMLEEDEGLVRQAAVLGLAELGGAASAKRLEQQLVREEARGDRDGDSVAEAITRALGELEESSARASLIRRLERLASGKPDLGDVNTIARALWHKRHPELLPVVRRSLETLALSEMSSLGGLLVLLEKSPGELQSWASDSAVPVDHKTEVLTVLEEEVPDPFVPAVLAFISTAHALLGEAVNREASYYCERLFILLLRHRERLFPLLPPESRAELREVARRRVEAFALHDGSLRAAVLLQDVGQPEDAHLLLAHRPAEPVLAKVFDDAVSALRSRPFREP